MYLYSIIFSPMHWLFIWVCKYNFSWITIVKHRSNQNFLIFSEKTEFPELPGWRFRWFFLVFDFTQQVSRPETRGATRMLTRDKVNEILSGQINVKMRPDKKAAKIFINSTFTGERSDIKHIFLT